MTSATGSAQAGFSLVELLVVLAILVGLTTAFPLALNRLQPERQLDLLATQLASDLRQQRLKASTEGLDTSVIIDTAAKSYRLLPQGERKLLPEAVALDAPTPDGSTAPEQGYSITFRADGTSSGTMIALRRADSSKAITVSALTSRVVIR